MANVTKCMCEECFYNQNYSCVADNIEVMSSGDMKVCSAEGTYCQTFKPKRG